jgi:hypothetical protein
VGIYHPRIAYPSAAAAEAASQELPAGAHEPSGSPAPVSGS